MKARSCVRPAAALLALALTPMAGQTQQAKQAQPPKPAASKTQEMLRMWNEVGGKLVTMAEDWPESKYDFKPNPAQRSFAEQLLHAAGTAELFTRAAKGETFSYDMENPPRATYKTKAQVVAFVKKAVEDGAATIQEQGDAGLDGVVKFPYGNMMAHRSLLWMEAAEHFGEHYGQLVVYYRVQNMVPPESRPRK